MLSRIETVALAACVLLSYTSVNAQTGNRPKATTKHVHAAHGPHHGELLEIGHEEYHAEVVIDEARHSLALYLLDSQVKSYVAIDAPFVGLNLKMAGKPVQLKLKPVPQDIDKPGFASRFVLESPELLKALHGGQADARIALKIGAKAYSIKLVHTHDHAGHDHAPTPKK